MSITLRIDNSVCQVSGLSSTQFKELKELMSYTVDSQAAFFGGGHAPRKRSLLDARGSFPTGLLYIAEEYFKASKILNDTVGRNDVRKPVRPVGGFPALRLGYPPYPEQKDAAEAAVLCSRGIISLPTGTGKSLVCALIIASLKVRSLVVVPSLELKAQLTLTLREAFGAENVGDKAAGRLITVENVGALDPKAPIKGIDCVIIDEFHRSGAKTYRQLNIKAWKDVYYKFGLTATPWRNDESERLLLESVLSKIIYRLDYLSAVKRGYIVPVEAYYVDLPKQVTDAYTWAQVYRELVVKNKVRNESIGRLLYNLHKAGKNTLCLVKEIAHGEELAQGAFPFANGQDGESNRLIALFNSEQGVSSVLIGTTGVVGEGVDTKPCEYVIIAGLGKAKGAFMQQVGRAVRRYQGKETAKIILFRDNSSKYTLRHFNAQRKVLLDEYGVQVLKLEV